MTRSSRSQHRSIESPQPVGVARRLAVASVLLLVSALAIVAGPTSDASAGGWAVASVDSIPSPRAGASEVIGFTILQHGVTPVDLLADPGNEVGIELVSGDGSIDFFPAVAGGSVGHYLATVRFDDAGDLEWSIRMGWFGSQALGTVTVSGAGSSSDGSSWPAVRVALSVLAAALAAGAVVDLWSARRRIRLAPS
jgi:hypothetical protein